MPGGARPALQPPAPPRLFSGSFKTLVFLFKDEREGRGVARAPVPGLAFPWQDTGRVGSRGGPQEQFTPRAWGSILVTY